MLIKSPEHQLMEIGQSGLLEESDQSCCLNTFGTRVNLSHCSMFDTINAPLEHGDSANIGGKESSLS